MQETVQIPISQNVDGTYEVMLPEGVEMTPEIQSQIIDAIMEFDGNTPVQTFRDTSTPTEPIVRALSEPAMDDPLFLQFGDTPLMEPSGTPERKLW